MRTGEVALASATLTANWSAASTSRRAVSSRPVASSTRRRLYASLRAEPSSVSLAPPAASAHAPLSAQTPRARGPRSNDEVLPHTIHAHGVFLRQAGTRESHQLVVHRNRAGGGKNG